MKNSWLPGFIGFIGIMMCLFAVIGFYASSKEKAGLLLCNSGALAFISVLLLGFAIFCLVDSKDAAALVRQELCVLCVCCVCVCVCLCMRRGISIYLLIYFSISLSVCLSVSLSLSLSLSIYLSIYLSIAGPDARRTAEQDQDYLLSTYLSIAGPYARRSEEQDQDSFPSWPAS